MYSQSRRLHNQLSRARSALNRPRLVLEDGHVPAVEAHRLTAPVEPSERRAYALVVYQTYTVAGPPGTGISHYAITFAPDGLGETVQLVVLTRDAAIYERAVAAEGDRRQRFDLTWHPSQRPDGLYCRMLDRLDALAAE